MSCKTERECGNARRCIAETDAAYIKTGHPIAALAAAARPAQQKDEPGHKHDAGKSRVDLIPPEFIEGIGHVFAYGAQKYGERNFEKGMSWGRIIGGLARHILAFMRREDNDTETGMPHTWHMGCCVAMLEFHRTRKVGTDDRSKVPSSWVHEQRGDRQWHVDDKASSSSQS